MPSTTYAGSNLRWVAALPVTYDAAGYGALAFTFEGSYKKEQTT